MKLRHVILSAALVILVLTSGSTHIRAHNGVDHQSTGSDEHPVAEAILRRGEVTREMPQRASGSAEDRKATIDARCAKITANINARLTNYADHKDAILGRYERMHERVTALLQKLDEKGYDTSTIRGNLATLQEMLGKAAANYRAFIAKLEATKQYACGNSDGQFLAALKESQEAMKVFQAELKEMRAFVQNTLRPNLKALKEQEPVALDETSTVRMRAAESAR